MEIKRLFALCLGMFLWSGCEDASSADDSAGTGEESIVENAEQDASLDEEIPSAALCEGCGEGEACEEGLVCIDTMEYGSICTSSCSASLNNCEPGYVCLLTGSTSADFHCLPKYPSCEADGEVCSPCENDQDCGTGRVCHQSSIDLGNYCFTACGADEECGSDTSGEKCVNSLCISVFDGVNRDVCNAGKRQLCQPCAYDFDCEEGMVCHGSFCSTPCEKFGGTSSTCPEGMFCPAGICEPPPSAKCQGWLGCSHGCDVSNGEICLDGFCKLPCSEGCPFAMSCDSEGLFCEEK